jgi:L-asparaginase II
MLALAHHHGWPIEGYHRTEHPVQRRVLKTLAAWCNVDAALIDQAIDGCGLPTFALPLAQVALACAKFAGARAGEPAATIASAMCAHPQFVAGTGRMCTALMAAGAGRLFAKVGAEGYYVAGIPQRRLGIALKVEDGAKRAAEPALLAVLRGLDVLSGAELAALHEFANPKVLNTRGETVGEVRAKIHLTSHSV